MVAASPKLACVMHAHHWLGWLAVNLALLWLGVEMRLPPAEPVTIAAFDDAYLVPTEFQVATVRGAPSRLRSQPATEVWARRPSQTLCMPVPPRTPRSSER
jgi:hypothetical protein